MPSRIRFCISGEGPLELRADIRFDTLRFAWRAPGRRLDLAAADFDASILSDEDQRPGLPEFYGLHSWEWRARTSPDRGVRPTLPSLNTANIIRKAQLSTAVVVGITSRLKRIQ